MQELQGEGQGLELAGGRYRILGKLGEGGMGFVYQAHDSHLDSPVVIKVPRPEALNDVEFTRRFNREIRSLVKLSHPNVVKVVDVGTHEGCPFIVMQFLAGGSLKDRLCVGPNRAPQPMAPPTVAGWLANVAAALDFIHRQGYVHRDVKPANILFDQHGHAYLSDFGIAKALANSEAVRTTKSLTGAGMVIGTPDYIAPEMTMGQEYDGRADQYALAVTVYEVLIGHTPFHGAATPAARIVMQTSREPPYLRDLRPEVPVTLADAVRRTLDKDPARRFPTCTAFAQAALAWLGTAPTAAHAVVAATAAAGVAAPPAEEDEATTPFACPSCKDEFELPLTALGQRVRCPACKVIFQVPAGPDLAPAPGTPPEALPAGGATQRYGGQTRPSPGLPAMPPGPWKPLQKTQPQPGGPAGAGPASAGPAGPPLALLIGGAVVIGLALCVGLLVGLLGGGDDKQAAAATAGQGNPPAPPPSAAGVKRPDQPDPAPPSGGPAVAPARPQDGEEAVLLKKGEEHYRKNEFDEAISALTRVIRLNPKSAPAYTLRGAAFYGKRDYDAGQQDLTEAIRLDPEQAWAYYHRGNVYQARKALDQALADFTTALKLNPRFREALLDRGNLYFQRREYDPALADYTALLGIEATDELATRAYYQRAVCYSRKNPNDTGYASALEDLTAALKLNPTYPSALIERGHVRLLYRNDYVGALEDLNAALAQSLTPITRGWALFYRAQALIARGVADKATALFDEAITDLTECLKIFPQDPETFLERGVAYWRKGALDRAIEDYSAALRSNPPRWVEQAAHHNRGICYYEKAIATKDTSYLDQALAEFHEALRLMPKNAATYFMRALTYNRKGEREKAEADLRKAAELDPPRYGTRRLPAVGD